MSPHPGTDGRSLAGLAALLAGPAAAQLIEDLAAHAAPPAPAGSLRAVSASAALARGRTCYDHLAGRLGVLVLDALAARGLVALADGVAVTPSGLRWLAGLGLDVGALRATRRPLARECLDWTERRPHLAGAAGTGLCGHFFAAGWIERTGGGRAVRVTALGHDALLDLLGIAPGDLEPVRPGSAAAPEVRHQGVG